MALIQLLLDRLQNNANLPRYHLWYFWQSTGAGQEDVDHSRARSAWRWAAGQCICPKEAANKGNLEELNNFPHGNKSYYC